MPVFDEVANDWKEEILSHIALNVHYKTRENI